MNPSDPNIELATQPARTQNPIPVPAIHQYNYQPQEDDESNWEDMEISQEPPQRPRNLDLHSQISRIWSDKLVNITILLTLVFYMIILGTCMVGLFNYIQQGEKFAKMNDLRAGPFRVMSESLNADPIMEIHIIDQGSICPAGFVPLRLGNWTGTVPGCYCETGDLLNTECKNANPQKCKKDIPAMNSIEMYVWENSIFCVKRAHLEADYLKKAECPSGYKECYPGGCFKGDCPITKLEIASSGPHNKERYLASTRTPGALPLINIQITLDEIPCFTRRNLTDWSYPLSAAMTDDRENECDKYGYDGNFTNKLDSQTAYDAYTQNSVPSSVIMNMPYFESYTKETSSILSSAVRMKAAKHDYCLEMKEIMHFDPEIFDPLYQSIIMGGSILLLLIIHLSCFIRGCKPHGFFTSPSELIRHFFKLHSWMSFYVFGGFLWWMTVHPKIKKNEEVLQEYDSLECFEGGQGSMVVRDYLKLLGEIGGVWISITCFIGVSHVLVSLTFVCYFMIKKRFT